MTEIAIPTQASLPPGASCPADDAADASSVGVGVDEEESADGVLLSPISTADVEVVVEGSLDDGPDDVAVADTVDDAVDDTVDDPSEVLV